MATNLDIDIKLIEKAQKLGHHATKKEAVNKALEEYVKRLVQLSIIDSFGKIAFDEEYDYKSERKR